jgi:HK97 family phage major capsid protein
MTNVPTWAQELTQQAYGAFMDLLTPESVVANLPMNSFSFDGFNSIYIPTRANRSKTLAAAFRAEGSPIRVGGAVTGSTLLTPKSLGVIGTFTAEMFRRSTPNIETLIRQWMIEDTSIALDGVFLGTGAGTAIQPAGIANSLGANTRASTGNTQADITADLRVMLQAMASAQLGRRPVWIMDPQRLIGLQTTLTPTGTLAYPSTADRRLMGYPIVTSLNVPDSEVFLVDCAEINFAGGVPVFMGTDVATIHEEDTTPLPLVTGAQGSGVVASPQRSLFQTNSAALRTMWELDWTVVRSGAVQQLTAVSW